VLGGGTSETLILPTMRGPTGSRRTCSSPFPPRRHPQSTPPGEFYDLAAGHEIIFT
jgi:hypothetical protein